MWHKWSGGENPVPGKKVNFKTERWFEKQPYPSDNLDWSVRGLGGIVEYEVVDDLQSRTNDASLQQAFDTVQRPAHYNQSGIESIDAVAASMSAEEFGGFLKGNVQKYVWRSEHKGGAEDYRKAQYYLNRLIKELSK